MKDPRLDWAFLEKYRFDEKRFSQAAERIRKGELTEASSQISEQRITPAKANDITDVTRASREELALRADAGRKALKAGKVAVLVLNGGMATRFGGVVKGVVEVFDGETFISLKGGDVRRARETYGAQVPFVLMNSFATNDATLAHLEERKWFGLPKEDVYTFEQSVSVRLNPDGSLFVGDDGKPSYYAPGHGDFFDSIRLSGVLGKLRARGVEMICFSNVDNLGATVDPALIGYHVLAGAEMSAEVTEKRRTASGAWDKGGAPCHVDGRLQIVEGFRFPPSFQQEKLPDFSTNNFFFAAAAIDRNVPLEQHVVKKKVDERPALQLESITCEASGVQAPDGKPLLRLLLLRVPRDGATGRFFPVKEPVDLDALRGTLKERLTEGWRLRGAGA